MCVRGPTEPEAGRARRRAPTASRAPSVVAPLCLIIFSRTQLRRARPTHSRCSRAGRAPRRASALMRAAAGSVSDHRCSGAIPIPPHGSRPRRVRQRSKPCLMTHTNFYTARTSTPYRPDFASAGRSHGRRIVFKKRAPLPPAHTHPSAVSNEIETGTEAATPEWHGGRELWTRACRGQHGDVERARGRGLPPSFFRPVPSFSG